MRDYEPLDLSAFSNAGRELYPPALTPPPAGAQIFHGLPFRIGAAGDEQPAGGDREPERPYLIAFGQGDGLRHEPLVVAVHASPRWVLFAHARLDSEIAQGDLPGRVVADYEFVFADGERVRVPIRERFEIGAIPWIWGQDAFLAWPDRKPGMQPRDEGPWGSAGYRQTEVTQGSPGHYYLWPWRNPRPAAELREIVIHPAGPKCVLAAITLSDLEEEPFGREARREVVITLPQPEDAAKPFALSVDVDRGAATYPYPLPASDAAGFLADSFKGWGEAQNPGSAAAYVEIAAIPSATVTVRQSGEELGRARWEDLLGAATDRGVPADGGRVRLEVVERGTNWVHTTVLDDETGKPVPCRVHFRAPNGIPYAPHGHHVHVNSNNGTWHIDVGGDVRLGQVSYAYIDGKCQGWLPRGEVIVDVARGYEYEPLRTTVRVDRGTRELTLRLKRWIHLNRERCFSGDTHVHFLSTQGGELEARGEDLNVVNLLQSQWGHLFTNTEEWTGRPHVSPDGQTIVYATQENRQHLLGHLTLLGLKEPVMPWCSDGPGEAELGGTLETTLSQWADACHAQGGTVVIPHLPNPNCEPAVLIATGRADAAEMLTHSPYFHLEYYRYLNAGYRLPLVGGTDKMTADVPVGIYRTYVTLPPDQEFTYDNWCAALRGGNTFLSGGPILNFTVEGRPPGSTVRIPPGGGTVEVTAVARSIFPIHTLQVVQGGQVVAATEETAGARELRLKAQVRVPGDTWLAARCGGPEYTAIPHHDGWRRGIMAHTSPVYLAQGDEYRAADPAALEYMLTLVHGGLEYIRHRSPQHPPGTALHHHGEPDHRAFLERPFQQALAAIHQRLHQLGIEH
jgi:hypothetical protein